MTSLSPKWLILLVLPLFQGCGWDIYDIPTPNDITKEYRVNIGNFVNAKISQDPTFRAISPLGQNHLMLEYLQQLYNQVNNELRQDIRSPDRNRWDSDREWIVRVLEDEENLAFSIPAGDIYLSTGLLKKINTEAELYYIMAVEATIVQNEHLIEALISEYTITPLIQLGQKDIAVRDRFQNIHHEIVQFIYGLEAIQKIQFEAESLICRSSLYNVSVYSDIISSLPKDSQWLSTRKLSTIPYDIDHCGHLRTNGGYKTNVLDRLN